MLALEFVRGVFIGTCLLLLRCADAASPRPQLVVWIDTNAPVVGMLSTHPELSRDAAIDIVHIEVLNDNGDTYASRDLLAPAPEDWPLSFGIVPARASATVHLRVRAYNAALVRQNDPSSLRASANVIIDRLADFVQRGDGIDARVILLDGACFGAQPTFATTANPTPHTCVDGHVGAPTDGIGSLTGGAPQSQVGTWARAKEAPCVRSPPAGSVCIPGGVTFLGDFSLRGFTNGITQRNSSPPRPVALSPFFLDRTEFTVGRYRKLVVSKILKAPTPGAIAFRPCTWLRADDPANDQLPLQCVDHETAVAACTALGGTLPSEAQWEHAARGRGQHFRYAWGNDEPVCCSASYAEDRCGPATVTPVGSHTKCVGGPVDVSADGVLDLAGSVNEYTSDIYADYDSAIWNGKIVVDPNHPTGDSGWTSRGAAWADPVGALLAALRFTVPPTETLGFRCAYSDGPP